MTSGCADERIGDLTGRARIRKPCIDCGRPTTGSRCAIHAPIAERARQAAQPYRAAYFSVEYRAARSERLRLAGGRCEAILAGARCTYPAQETHHLIPLSSARTYPEALALCTVENLRAVCWRHNPRGT